jgi:hypothetical protein
MINILKIVTGFGAFALFIAVSAALFAHPWILMVIPGAIFLFLLWALGDVILHALWGVKQW